MKHAIIIIAVKLGVATYVRVPTVIQWLISQERLSIFLALLALPILILNVWSGFAYTDLFMAHDEAEHLHVVFDLERGEIPYRDFIENHPVLFHIVLLKLKQALGLSNAMQVFWLGRSLVFIHFVCCMIVIAWMIHGFVYRLFGQSHAWALLIIALVLTGIWIPTGILVWGHESLWQIRPDWLCYAYTFLGIALHYTWHRNFFLSTTTSGMWMPILAGASCGLATAILAKSIYVFLPYALTYLIIGLNYVQDSIKLLHKNWRRLLVANTLFVFLGVMVLLVAISFELHVSGASIAEYWAANFQLNSVKHIIINSEDFNPFNIVFSLLGLSFTSAILLFIAFILRIFYLARYGASEEFAWMGFVIVTTFINMMLPAFSNGLTWIHYYIPSLIAILLLLSIVLGRFFNTCSRLGAEVLLIRVGSIMGVISFIVLIFLVRSLYVIDRMSNIDDTRSEMKKTTGTIQFTPEYILPKQATYFTLGFKPQYKPVQAKAWGYFFMLAPDKGLWSDNYRLGLGPNPKTHWKSLFTTNPPDFVISSGKRDFMIKQWELKNMQDVDISWLWPKLVADYACMSKGISMYARRSLISKLEQDGWSLCPVEVKTNDEL